MGYSSQNFQYRSQLLGRLAESAFIRWAEKESLIYVRYGFDDPPFKKFPKIPFHVRITPDFVVEGKEHIFMECKGSNGRILKMKHETMRGLVRWNDDLPVWFFIYDSNKNRHAVVSFAHMEKLCEEAPTKEFASDHKKYYEISGKKLDWKETPNGTPKGY